MDTPSPAMRDLAQRLLALEAASQSELEPNGHAGMRVCDKLQICLTRFAGADGFTALLRRALALARPDVPLLQSVKVTPDCRGLEEFAADPRNESLEAVTAIIAHLLGLLATLIGEPLTLRMVREAWPDSSLNE